MEKRYLNIKELSEYTGFSVHTLYTWVSQELIPFHKPGGKILRFDKEEIDKWMHSPFEDTLRRKKKLTVSL